MQDDLSPGLSPDLPAGPASEAETLSAGQEPQGEGLSRRRLLGRMGMAAGVAATATLVAQRPVSAQAVPDLTAPRVDRYIPPEVTLRQDLDAAAELLATPKPFQAYASKISQSQTFPAENNTLSVGPISVEPDVEVTVLGEWTIV